MVCGGLVGFNMFRAKAIQGFFASMKRPAVIVSVADVVPVTWQPAIDAFGTVSASQGTDVAVELGGVVTAIMFKANERVAAGQVLVQIDDAVERADLLGIQSNLATAKRGAGPRQVALATRESARRSPSSSLRPPSTSPSPIWPGCRRRST